METISNDKYSNIKNGDFSEIDNSIDLYSEDENLWLAIVEGCKINLNLELLLKVIDALEKNDNSILEVYNSLRKKIEENKVELNKNRIEAESIRSNLKEPDNTLININVREIKKAFELVGVDLSVDIINAYVALLKKMYDDLGEKGVTSYMNFIFASLNTKYGDNKDFLDNVKKAHSGIMLNISLNSMLEIEGKELQLLDGILNNLEEKNTFIVKELESYDAYNRDLAYFIRRVIEVCKKYPEECNPVIERLINFKNENVRVLCYLNFFSSFYYDFNFGFSQDESLSFDDKINLAFSQDKSPRVSNLYDFIHGVSAWLADPSVREEDKIRFVGYVKKISKCTFYRRKSIKEGHDGIMTAYYHMGSEGTVFAYNLYATKEEIQLYEDIKCCDNENLCNAKAYLFYELVSSNKIEFIDKKPSFIMNKPGFGRKLLSDNK